MTAADMTGRTCVITGATSGIGQATAVGLASLGARVILVARDPVRAAASVARVKAASGSDAVELALADLASLDSIRALAGEIRERAPSLHVLVNNAGIVNLSRKTTLDGFESTFAVNHLAYFLLTRLLLDRLLSSPRARIVSVSSDAHRFGAIDLDDLQHEKRRFSWWRAYGASKLANILFTCELARRLAERDATANCLHPGAVATRLGTNNGLIGRSVTRLLRPFFLTPEQGSETSIYLASSPEVEGASGGYYVKRAARRPSRASSDERLARQLWEVSERLTGLSG